MAALSVINSVHLLPTEFQFDSCPQCLAVVVAVCEKARMNTPLVCEKFLGFKGNPRQLHFNRKYCIKKVERSACEEEKACTEHG